MRKYLQITIVLGIFALLVFVRQMKGDNLPVVVGSQGNNNTSPGVPESFNVLVQELRGLALDVRIYDERQNEISLSEWSDSFGRSKKKIKLETLHNVE